MITVDKTIRTQHKIDNIYNIVKDIDHYKFFLPWCDNSRILKTEQRSDGKEQVIARIDVSKFFVHTYFVSKNTYTPYTRIDLSLVEGPFSHLQGYWTFKAVNNYTEVSFHLDYKFDNMILSKLYSALFETVTDKIVYAFLKRADNIYGEL